MSTTRTLSELRVVDVARLFDEVWEMPTVWVTQVIAERISGRVLQFVESVEDLPRCGLHVMAHMATEFHARALVACLQEVKAHGVPTEQFCGAVREKAKSL